MSWTSWKGFNFRGSDTYVTDGANEIPIWSTDLSNNITIIYPASRTIDGDTFNCGFEVATGNDGHRDRNDAIDARLAGHVFASNDGSSQRPFRIALPSAGAYEIRLAMGEAANPSNQYWQIVDDTTVLETFDYTGTANGAAQWRDATGTLHTSAANWVANQTAKQYTFASTIFRVRVGTASASTGTSTLAHLAIRLASGGGSIGFDDADGPVFLTRVRPATTVRLV